MEALKLAICVPSRSEWHADFGMCLLAMYSALAQKAVPGFKGHYVRFVNKRGSMLPKLRQDALNDAVMMGSTHALFLDSDMYFPHDLVHRLLSHKKAVVACNCATKATPASPTARAYVEGDPRGRPIFTTLSNKSLERVWRVGTGVMLIELKAIRNMPRPWFELKWSEAIQDFEGEDWYFCRQLEAAGIDLYVDHAASAYIGHLGDYMYTHDDVAVENVLMPGAEDKDIVNIKNKDIVQQRATK